MPRASQTPLSSEIRDLSDAVVRTIREPLLILDGAFRVRAANPMFYRAFVTKPDDTIGRLLFDLGNGQWDIPALRTLLEQVLPEDLTVEDFEVEHEFETLGWRFMLLNARRLERDAAGDELILLAIQDVTDQKRAEHELLRSNQELERFAYVASHDLQEPLRMVASYTRLLAKRYEGHLDARADKYIRYASEGAERMKTLIQDLLAYSRVTTQASPLVSVDLNEVLAGVIEDLGVTIRRTGAAVTHDRLPTALADAGQVRQVLQNLIQNAIKFSGDSPPVIHVSGRREGSRCIVSVRDEGVGIESQYFERIFVIFQRLQGRESPGTGIGLALCKRIVDRHGGEIWVESEPGEGSTFHFTLPASDDP